MKRVDYRNRIQEFKQPTKPTFVGYRNQQKTVKSPRAGKKSDLLSFLGVQKVRKEWFLRPQVKSVGGEEGDPIGAVKNNTIASVTYHRPIIHLVV